MFWKTDLGKILILLLIGVVIAIPVFLLFYRLNSQPLQTASVKVISKKLEIIKKEAGFFHFLSRSGVNTRWYVTFEFSDGSEKQFRVLKAKIYDELQEGDTGILSYKEVEGAKFQSRGFKNFEKTDSLFDIINYQIFCGKIKKSVV